MAEPPQGKHLCCSASCFWQWQDSFWRVQDQRRPHSGFLWVIIIQLPANPGASWTTADNLELLGRLFLLNISGLWACTPFYHPVFHTTRRHCAAIISFLHQQPLISKLCQHSPYPSYRSHPFYSFLPPAVYYLNTGSWFSSSSQALTSVYPPQVQLLLRRWENLVCSVVNGNFADSFGKIQLTALQCCFS